MTDRELLQQALVALEKYEEHTRGVMIPSTRNRGDSVVEAIRARLAQPEQEPLTDEEITCAFAKHDEKYSLVASFCSFEAGVRYAEAAHNIKETK